METCLHGPLMFACHHQCMARPAQFGKDTGLQARMLTTMFLLGLVYVVFAGVIFAAGGSGIAIVLFAVVMLSFQFFASDALALRAMGAKEVSPAELEGVLAHELTHVINRDVMIMTIASFFAMLAGMITQFGFFYGGGRNRNNDQSFAIVLLVSLAVYVISFFLMHTLSRYREYAADRGAAIITGRPSALASALLKISGTMARVPQQDLRAAEQMNAFFIIPAGVKKGAAELFATHPSVEKRIARLQRLEAQLQGAPAAA
jgi:Zn-dependent protease with chaperone function